ncbi:MAG: glycosyltransferase [Anaerolineae bacterium]|nr:glycosyltransferase [Anaerolineae bacterium]
MQILFLSRWFPYPPHNGSKLRILNLLRALASRHEVTLISFNDQPEKEADLSGLAAICRDVHVIPWRPYNPDSGRARLGFFNTTPRFIMDTFSPEMKSCIEEVLAHGRTELIIASQIDMAAYFATFGNVPALFEEAEVGTLYEQFIHARSLKNKARYGLTWGKHRYFLQQVLAHFRACTVVSAREKELLATAVTPHTPITIIPNCIDLADYGDVHETAVPHTLIFTGAFTYQPNYEAMVWFLEKVWPHVLARIPDAQLTITGNHADLPLPTTHHVTLTGFVDDVRPYIVRAWASLVPIWTGGGTRLKILEAMALGTPVIATGKGAEGLDAVPGKHLLVADAAEDYATAVIQLLQNATLRHTISQNAAIFVAERYNWSVVAPRFLEVVERAAQG